MPYRKTRAKRVCNSLVDGEKNAVGVTSKLGSRFPIACVAWQFLSKMSGKKEGKPSPLRRSFRTAKLRRLRFSKVPKSFRTRKTVAKSQSLMITELFLTWSFIQIYN